jgi:membrane protease YdiL (CAAX protease family)
MKTRYRQEVAKYGKKDAIIALCTYPLFVVLTIGFWELASHFEWIGQQGRFASWIFAVFMASIIVTIVVVKKQGLSSIGIHKDKILPALRLGLLFCLIPVFIGGVLPWFFYGWEVNYFGQILLLLFSTFVLAAFEDIIFVGFIQTRLYGIFKSDMLAICLCAILFALLHIPVGLATSGGHGFLGVELILYLVVLFIGHIILVLLFKRYFSLLPVFMFHTMSNFVFMGRFWMDFDSDYLMFWQSISFIVMLLALSIWALYLRRLAKNNSTKE